MTLYDGSGKSNGHGDVSGQGQGQGYGNGNGTNFSGGYGGGDGSGSGWGDGYKILSIEKDQTMSEIQNKIIKLEAEIKALKDKCDCDTECTEDYKIVRSDMAGVFFGKIIAEHHHPHGHSVILQNARRIFLWQGAATLSELAMRGTSQPHNCKFPVTIALVEINGVNEVLNTTPQARASINSVPIWWAK